MSVCHTCVQVSSYGGYLRFTLSYSTAFDAGNKYMDVDLEIIVSWAQGNPRIVFFGCSGFRVRSLR